MTTTVQAPPPTAVPAGPAAAGPPRGPRSRRWLLGFWAVVFALFLAVRPGRQTFDTKLGVTVDPGRFLADLGQLWQSRGSFGGIADQYTGYLWPMLPYYWLADLVRLPVWLAERLWMSLIVTAAFWGALRLAERLRVGRGASRPVAAAAYALWPVFTAVVGSTSAAALPGALLPWVLLPLADQRYTARVTALRSALLVPFMGGVNAASTLASLLPVGLYLLSRPPGARKWRLIAWWAPAVAVATAWWWIPLLLLGVHGENFLPYIETARTTTDTMAATEALRGAGNWVAYLHFGEPWLPAGWAVASSAPVIVCSACAAGLGLAGLARRDMPERRWLVLTVVAAVLVLLAGYGGASGGPFHGTVQDWLDGRLSPFRNVYKFQTGLALALVCGLAHLAGRGVPGRGTRRRPGARTAALLAAVLVLPGLAWPYIGGKVLGPGSFQEIPAYWRATADWLEQNSPDARALVVPATAHGIHTWGSTIDQPLDVVAGSPWAQRDYVPFGTPGNRRALDAVEQALLTGGEIPGLADYLGRAGVHYVVVRNDLDPDQLGQVPTATVKRALEQSGYERVEGLGPVTTGGVIAPGTPLQVEGLYPRQRAVEIYRPAGTDVPRPGRAGLLPVADTAVVSGGPESLLPSARELRGRPAVLTGDAHPGLGAPAVQVTGDGLRRADTRFGLVNSHTSYTYTPDERNASDAAQDPGERPRQILPVAGEEHQTVAELRGAREVSASSYGNWLFHLPQYDPVHAFDGDPATGWAEGAEDSPDGQWLRIAFDGRYDMPDALRVNPLPQNGVRAAPTEVRVETENGSATSFLRVDGERERIDAPAGPTRWMKLTITGSTVPRPGVTGAGFSEVELPGVKVTRLLRLPEDGKDTAAPARIVSLHRAADPTGLSLAGSESGLRRIVDAGQAGTYAVRARAVAVPGEALDRLLYEVAPEQRRRIVATAASTARLGAGLSARNLTDGDLTTAWIAGDDPTVRLSWPGKRPVGELVLAPAGGLSARAEEVRITSPTGAVVAGVDAAGWVRFPPMTTDRLDITVTRTAPLTVHNPAVGEDLRLPVGLTEAYVPALDDLRTKQPKGDPAFSLACGKGPALTVDGERYDTAVRGAVRDLVERRPVEVTPCRDGRTVSALELAAGPHEIEADDAGPLTAVEVTLTLGTVPDRAATGRDLRVRDWAGDRREVLVGPGAASYLTTHENHNDGWKATLDGEELTPLRLDGWQQGWLVPAGEGGTVTLSYGPATTYGAALIASGAGIVALAGLLLWRRHAENPDGLRPASPAPGVWLGTVVVTLTGVVVAGWWALLLPPLALLAWRRRSLLPPLAFATLTGAGLTAAVGAGGAIHAGEGAFGHVAQVLSLTGLFAGLVTLGAGRERDETPAGEGPGPEEGGTRAPAAGEHGTGHLAGGPGATAPLPAPADPAAPSRPTYPPPAARVRPFLPPLPSRGGQGGRGPGGPTRPGTGGPTTRGAGGPTNPGTGDPA